MVILVGRFSECIRIETEAAYEGGASLSCGERGGDALVSATSARLGDGDSSDWRAGRRLSSAPRRLLVKRRGAPPARRSPLAAPTRCSKHPR